MGCLPTESQRGEGLRIFRAEVLHYQPKVDLRTGALTGAEALVCWNHPVHDLVYPDALSIGQRSVAQSARWRTG